MLVSRSVVTCIPQKSTGTPLRDGDVFDTGACRSFLAERCETVTPIRSPKMFLIANLVTTSKAPVTTSVALVTTSKQNRTALRIGTGPPWQGSAPEPNPIVLVSGPDS